MNLRAAILGSKDIPQELMVVPEWTNEDGTPVTILIKGFDARAFRRFTRLSMTRAEGDRGAALLDELTTIIAMCVCDPQTGEPIFNEAEDLEALDRKSGEVVQRITMRIMALAGLGKDAVEDAKAF
jgi:hypothetical protein